MPITKASGNSVTAAAKGDLVVGNATNDSGVLAVGTTDQVLTVDSTTATGLKWATPATPASGGMTLLSTTSFSGTSTTISSINQSYINLVIMIENWYKSGSGDFPVMQWNGLTGANYAGTRITGGNCTGFSSQSLCVLSPNQLGTSNTNTNMVITFPNYTQTLNQIPTWTVNTSSNANYTAFGVGQYAASGSAAALTSLTLRTDTLASNNIGTIKIYGVK